MKPSFKSLNPIKLKLASYCIAMALNGLAASHANADILVNGAPIPVQVIEFIQADIAQDKNSAPPSAQEIKDFLIERALTTQEALNRKLDQAIDYRGNMYRIERELALKNLKAAIFEQAKRQISANQLNTKTNEIFNKLSKQGKKEYLAKHILVKDVKEANEIIAKLKQGQKFESLVAASIEPGAADRGGSLGWAQAEQYVPEFAAALKQLKEATYTTKPIKTEFGYHVIFLEKKRPYPTRETVKAEVEQRLVLPLAQQRWKLIEQQKTKTTSAISSDIVAYFAKPSNDAQEAKSTEKKSKNTKDNTQAITEKLQKYELFYQAAKRQGVLESKLYQAELYLERQKLLTQLLMRDIFETTGKSLSDEKIKADYAAWIADLQKQPALKQYKARHILVKDEAQAKQIIAALNKQEKFETLAKTSLDTSNNETGGDLGWADPETYVKAFSDALSQLTKGNFTQTPVKTEFGWHVILLDDVRDKERELPEFETFKINAQNESSQQAFNELVKTLKSNAKIEESTHKK